MPHDQDPTAALAAEWNETLRCTGQFDTDDERELLRSAGREAGRLPVRTLVQGTSVLVVLDDWMDSPLQGR